MIKMLRKSRKRGECSQLDKEHQKKKKNLTANLMPLEWKAECFPLVIRNKAGMSLSPLSFNIVVEVLATGIKQEK